MSDADRMNAPTAATDATGDPSSLGGAFADGTLMARMGMTVIERSPECTRIAMPVAGNTQPAGLLHGGASAALAETAASFAALAHAEALDPDGLTIAVGTELSISHLVPGRSGMVTATATAVHLGRGSTVHVVDIRDEDDRLLATSRVTNRILRAR